MKQYQEFANTEFDKMLKMQDEFILKYNTNAYSNWFYDQESELLRLYNEDGGEIFFKYIPVGSYSLISNTWMWSWENKGSIEEHKNETLKVRKLGEQFGFEYLTNGLFECEKEECWKFTAISKKLIGGIGVYCTNSKDLLKYILIKEVFDGTKSDEVRKLKQKTVECGVHGFRRPAFVCKHLNLKEPKGFVEAFETVKAMNLEDDEDFAAWCNDCEEYRIKNDGWNEESEKFAEIKLVCEECYFELKEFNK